MTDNEARRETDSASELTENRIADLAAEAEDGYTVEAVMARRSMVMREALRPYLGAA